MQEPEGDGGRDLSGDLPEGLAVLGVFGSVREAHECGLVVLSQNEPYWVVPGEEGFRLLAASGRADFLREQIGRYREESVGWPPARPSEPPLQPFSLVPALSWILVMSGAYGVSRRWPDWVDWGMLSSRDLVEQGEYYRAVSALFLHGDDAHLMGNLVFGSICVHLASRTLGGWRTWVALLVPGTLGNIVNAWAHWPAVHLSLGASTAVFGLVGVLSSLPVGRYWRDSRGWTLRDWGAPLVSGLILLGWLGTGQAGTDVGAHLFGFLCGLPLGTLLGLSRWGQSRPRV